MANRKRLESTLRQILVPLDSKIAAKATIESAFQVADMMASHVRVLVIAEDPTTDEDKYPPAVVDLPPPEGALRVRGDDVIARRRMEEIADAFDEACRRHGCRAVTGRIPLTKASGSLETASGDPAQVISRHGRRSDLIVIGKPTEVSRLRSRIRIGAALFETGRPVLVAPPHPVHAFGRSVAIAWNDTPESSRAVAAAMKFIVRAEQVYVLTAESLRTPRTAAAELVDYLALHGIEAQPRVFASMGDKPLGGKRLLAECTDVKADLMVMGAFRLGRFAEQVLGPATSEVLEHAAIPILMAR